MYVHNYILKWFVNVGAMLDASLFCELFMSISIYLPLFVIRKGEISYQVKPGKKKLKHFWTWQTLSCGEACLKSGKETDLYGCLYRKLICMCWCPLQQTPGALFSLLMLCGFYFLVFRPVHYQLSELFSSAQTEHKPLPWPLQAEEQKGPRTDWQHLAVQS